MSEDEQALRLQLEDRRAMFIEMMRDIGDHDERSSGMFCEVARLVGIVTFWLSFETMPPKMIADVSKSLAMLTPIKVVTP